MNPGSTTNIYHGAAQPTRRETGLDLRSDRVR